MQVAVMEDYVTISKEGMTIVHENVGIPQQIELWFAHPDWRWES
jgi:hypothetical protein